MKKRGFLLMGAVFAALFFCGCEDFNEFIRESIMEDQNVDDPDSDEYQAKFAIGLFTIVRYPRATELEKEIQGIDGKSVWINVNQNFSSKNVQEAKAVPRPGNPDLYDIRLRLDRSGKLLWQIMAGRHNEEPMAFVVDGIYFATFIPQTEYRSNFEWVTLNVGIDPVTAKGIAKYAKPNYKHYNPDAQKWF